MSEGTLAEVLAGSASWCVIEGDCSDVLPTLPDKSVAHVICDPPYSARTHAAAAAAAAARGLPDGSIRRVYNSKANGFGFACLAPGQRESLVAEFARTSSRWVVVFTDQEGVGPWLVAIEESPLDHVRIGQWVKIGAAPQFTGDRPASHCEAIMVAHTKGRKRWNGGGRAALWEFPIAAVEGRDGANNEGRPEHITPKPVALMLALVSDFTDPGELVLDPFCGSGTTGVACLRLGRRFIGIEKDPKYAAIARERLRAESQGLSLRDARAGQLPMFSEAK